MLVPADRLAAGAAASAFFDAGVRDAGAADPLTVQGLVDADLPAAARAGRQHDSADAARVQVLDEPRDHSQRRTMPLAGQQGRVGFQRPGHPPLVAALTTAAVENTSDGITRDGRIECGDGGVDDRDRVTIVGVRALGAAWMPVAVM